MSWFCSCGILNSGLNKKCASDRLVEHYQISSNKPDALMSISAAIWLESKNMTENEELFAKYYNRGKVLVADMDDVALRDHREELRKIATEAKAQLMAADDEIRERSAKKKTKDKEWLVSIETDSAATDALNTVKTRSARMSKLDKIKKQLEDAGLDDATVKEMVANLSRKATEQQMKTVTFNKPATETAVVQVQAKKAEENKDTMPFDPTKLSFGK